MVNPGAFQGARKAFLIEQKPAYEAAFEGGYVLDFVSDIQRRFFKRFPVEMPIDQEPSPEELAEIDDNAPEPEPVEPDEESMPKDEYDAAMKVFVDHHKLVTFRKKVCLFAFLLTQPRSLIQRISLYLSKSRGGWHINIPRILKTRSLHP